MNKLLLLAALALVPVAQAARVSCKSFPDWKSAQAYYKRTGLKALDRNGDGIACECNKGGPKAGTSVCRGK